MQAHAQRAALTMRRPVPPQRLDHVLGLVRFLAETSACQRSLAAVAQTRARDCEKWYSAVIRHVVEITHS